MKVNIYIFLDIAIYFVQGLLLVMLLKTAQARFSFKKVYANNAIILMQYVVIQMFLHYSQWVKSLIYGKNMIMNNSRQSIILVLISMFVTCAVSLFLLKESRLKIIYYVVTFYSVMELLRIAVYPLLSLLLTKLVSLNQYLFLNRQMYGQEMFFEVAYFIEVFWNILFAVTLLIFTYMINKRIKKYVEIKENYQRSQLIFLLVPSVIGLLLCLIIRSIMFSMDNDDIYLLFDSRPEMNILIPCISLLCIFLIIIVAKVFRKLMDESNHKIEINVYQEQIKEMEQHIQDIQNLYAGIRGMKHDMKNYIADMEALINTEPKKQSDNKALKQYLDSLQTSVEQLDMKYNTGNAVTDVIIQRYVGLAKNNNIDFQSNFIFPSDMNIDAFDLSIIINNALDNAVEACKKQKEGKKFIELTAYQRQNMFLIIIKNSFDGTVIKNESDGRLLTTKSDSINHGLGLKNIEMCTEKYYGKAEITVKDKVFELAVMLQKRISG